MKEERMKKMAHRPFGRQFPTGANRSENVEKVDYEGCLSPAVLKRFAYYMLQHQHGGKRTSDNWQLGIPREEYLKSLLRHVVDLWDHHRRGEMEQSEDLACAILFNIQGYLHEILHQGLGQAKQTKQTEGP